MANKLVQISLPQDLLIKVDEAAQEEFMSRSEFIRSALITKIKEVNSYRAYLSAAANNTDIPTEEMILKWLKHKQLKRYLRSVESERRKDSLA